MESAQPDPKRSPTVASIPDLGSRDPLNADRPAGSASNGVSPGQSSTLMRGAGAIGGAQEAHHQPKMTPHPQGPFVGRDGQRFKVDSC
jgi:hypothetical protein